MVIFWLLHVGTPGVTTRKIDKIKPLLDLFLPRFRELYVPASNLSVDETMIMIGFRGRFGSTQYMPQKPTKWGIKLFTLADSANGYLLNALVYTGAETLEHADPTYSSLPVPGRVVLDVMTTYLDQGYHVFTDRCEKKNIHESIHMQTYTRQKKTCMNLYTCRRTHTDILNIHIATLC